MSEEKQARPQFYQDIVQRIVDVFGQLLTAHPELRTLAAVIDYRGVLNDSGVPSAVWIGERGAPTRPDEVFGSMFQTVKLVDKQIASAWDMIKAMRDVMQSASAAVVAKRQELSDLEKKIAEVRADSAGKV